ncbi:hypothetical protein PC128_g19587 [Phytophthora cactorum]|nr:hypothetical protein PC128_g19587 [Phytophthora cactorum]
MAKTTAGETYEAFKARKREEFDTRYAGRTQVTQQNLLRVHLRHFLLTVGAEVDHERRRLGDCTDFVNQKENADEIHEFRSFASEQRRLAVDREAAKAKRQRSAQTIQKFVRRRRHPVLREGASIRDEEELPSTSVLIPLEVKKTVVPLKATTENVPVGIDVIPQPTATLPPYEVVVELVAVRDLALDFANLDGKYLETELQLKRQIAVVSRVVPARQFVSGFQDNTTEIQLQNCSLRFSMDLNNGMRHSLASPQCVIDELNAAVIVKATENSDGGNVNTLGVVEIPLSLLETPLATEYALCRWFPLEKAYPGHAARGDVRVSVCYLMRQQNPDGVTMVPYVTTTSSVSASDDVEVQQIRKNPIDRRVKKAPAKSARTYFQRSRADQATDKSEKLKSPVLSLKDAFSSPIGRISRAEALSPPPSPSSVASSDAGENVDSPRTAKTRRPLFSSKRQQKISKPVQSSPPEEEQVVEAKENSSRTPPKTFLKRKPYKVVFQKLDWSSVASKTDSNSSSSCKTPSASSRSSKTPRSSSRGSTSTIATSNTRDTITDTDSVFIPKPGAFIDAAAAETLTALETEMYKQCGVTRETASLARFKYQTERKKFVVTLQRQRRIGTDSSTQPDQPPSQDSSEPEIGTATSEAAVMELWKKLTTDSSGQIYASMLRNLTESAKPIESTEPGTAS